MTDPRRIGLRYIGDGAHLLGIQASEGDLNPHHLHAGLALTIDAVLEAEGAEHIGRDFGIQDFGGFFLEGFNLLQNFRRNRRRLSSSGTRWNRHDAHSSIAQM